MHCPINIEAIIVIVIVIVIVIIMLSIIITIEANFFLIKLI